MTSRNDDLFPDLDPPPGGLASLRRRIAAAEARPARFARRAAFAMSIALVLTAGGAALLARTRAAAIPAETPWENAPGMISLGLRAPPAEPVTVLDRATFAAAPVAVTDEVVFYLVGTTRPDPDPT